eukprot:3207321-Rhodomonas_salina.1
MQDMIAALLKTFPAGGSREQIARAIGTGVEEANTLIQLLCRYLIRHVSHEDDSSVISIFNRERDAASRHCRAITDVILPALVQDEELRAVCETDLPAVLVKFLVRLETLAVAVDTGRGLRARGGGSGGGRASEGGGRASEGGGGRMSVGGGGGAAAAGTFLTTYLSGLPELTEPDTGLQPCDVR